MRFKNIIFDFDGTLVDSKPGVVKSFKKVVKELAGKEINEQQIIELVGLPLAQILGILLNTNDQTIIEQGSALFRKYYGEEGFSDNVIYPRIKETLKSLSDQGFQLFAVSNKIESFINKILEQHGIKKYFVFVRGTDGTDKKSEKTKYIKEIIKKYKLKKEETVMVGDTENDILAGKENFIHTIGITWGYGSEADLIKAGPDIICRKPSDLKSLFKN